ncbi:hypothetical protein SSP24_42320 [Streptomyces spinoverrucosus]|uniref:CYTH domain-containing protein n=1 Tax=Streptomyces spinoverrucosus TaxID=284043 RepID=A0A4Y3VI91_9ACTN|nr:CYTH domain-containing protein [Streptomyces spinoverrucosus]GEC06577.1 hypothetical protein SSP24_42320 [Streptomyces spinoverrucosus]GHB54198.1 hypothetical protein GCM10010397_25520 [Streptomyces spinoverrucosus]
MLAGLGCKPDAPVTEVDTYYSCPGVDYMKTVECLRVRQRGDFPEITYKPPSTTATHSTDSVISKPETNVHLIPGHAGLADQLLEKRIVAETEQQLGVSDCPVIDLPYRDLGGVNRPQVYLGRPFVLRSVRKCAKRVCGACGIPCTQL